MMSKFLVKPSTIDDIDILINKDIYGIIYPIKDLSIYSSFYLDIDYIKNIKTNKKKIILLNKIMHNKDLDLLDSVLSKIDDSIDYIIFYDMAVYELSKKYNLIDKLVIAKDHLNRSTLSNNFYKSLGINNTYITSDITIDDIKEIKKYTNMSIFYTIYGNIPIFCSKRKLLSNYFKYIDKPNTKNTYTLINNDKTYTIREENNTIIYSDLVNLINEIDNINDIDYLVIDLNINNNIEVLDKFINKDKDGKDYYLGFYNTKTIFKVKK